MSQLNIEQARASKAYKFAESGKSNAEYSTNAQKLPMYIKVNGLGNTLAFMYSKKSNKGWELLYKQLHEWLREAEHSIIQTELSKGGEFVQVITQLDSEKYRFATREILALAAWLKRFVKQD